MSGLSTSLPERKRRYRVSMMPFADAMFQLLIFFMLASSLESFSLVTIQTDSNPVEDNVDGSGDSSTEDRATTSRSGWAFWHLRKDVVSVAGQDYGYGKLSELAEALAQRENDSQVVVIIDSTVNIQTLAKALEALENANIKAVQIARLDGE